jgi:Predicted phosphoesterase or phosphohydrolase
MICSSIKDIHSMLSKKHPDKNIYLISDQHFYHRNIIIYGRNEFANLESMHEYIISKHNAAISDNDIVIFLGDFCFKKSQIHTIVEQLNGIKYLILGNHDQENLVRKAGICGFENIFYTPVKLKGDYLSHQPLTKEHETDLKFRILISEFEKESNKTNYHGHIHTTDSLGNRFKNVTCEALDYTPLLIGNTDSISQEKGSLPNLINSNIFSDILKMVEEKSKIASSILINDYIYSMMLEASTPFAGSVFVYGSFPLFKKYGYASNFSDLDIGMLYNEENSRNYNYKQLKYMVDSMYSELMNIDDINLKFLKRIANMCAFEFLFANKSGFYATSILDANVVPFEFHKASDFVRVNEHSVIEDKLKKLAPSILSSYSMPKYETNYLKAEGDTANLLLQLLFQRGFDNKKTDILKKIKYVNRSVGNIDLSSEEFENILIRFFLRNILFFQTLRRYADINYIEECYKNMGKLLKLIPPCMQEQVAQIIANPSSEFNQVLKEIIRTDPKELPKTCKLLVKVKI